MERSNLFAFTELGAVGPGYISVNRVGADVIEVTVRNPAQATSTGAPIYGAEAAIALTPGQALALGQALVSKLGT